MRKIFTGAALLSAVAVTSSAFGQVGYDPVANRSYLVNSTAQTWTAARSTAVGAGRDLVSIGSASENGLVDALGGDMWIGFTDDPAFGGTEFGNTSALAYPAAGQTPASEAGTQRGEGWIWSDGTSPVYQNWGGGEPNDAGGENFANIRGDGAWNDLPATSSLPSVQEVAGRVQGTLFNGHEYLIIPAGSFTDARAQAQALGGTLVVINNAAENTFLDNLVSGSFWIGYSDDASEGDFDWADGTDDTGYNNWNAGEPNNAGGTEHYAEMNDGGGWNDLPNDFARVAVVEIVPEPTALGLLAFAGVGMLARRRR